eukprot:6190554-Pleurochrysis_carterae.AAC.2
MAMLRSRRQVGLRRSRQSALGGSRLPRHLGAITVGSGGCRRRRAHHHLGVPAGRSLQHRRQAAATPGCPACLPLTHTPSCRLANTRALTLAHRFVRTCSLTRSVTTARARMPARPQRVNQRVRRLEPAFARQKGAKAPADSTDARGTS